MSYHIVSIDSPQCSLSCRDGQLTCKTAEGEKKLPLEDVASIIITSFSASIHSNLFLEAAKHGVALIICESFKPVSLVLPANRSTDTILSRALLSLTANTRRQLWQKTVDAKCQNQYSLAEHIAPADERLASFRETAFGKKPHKEAICAKSFWQVIGRSVNDEEFIRDRARGGLNNLLNYGYAVLLSTVLQKIVWRRSRPDVRHFPCSARAEHAAGLRPDGAVPALRGLACFSVGEAAPGQYEMGSGQGISQMGDGLPTGTSRLPGLYAGDTRLH